MAIPLILTMAGTEALKKVIALAGDRLSVKLPKGPDSRGDLLSLHQSLERLEKVIDALALVLGGGGKRLFAVEPEIAAVLQDANGACSKISDVMDRLTPTLEIFAPDVKERINRFHASEADIVNASAEGIAVVDDLGRLRAMATEAKTGVGDFIKANYSFRDVAP